MSRAVLSIGSNVGDRFAHLQGCVQGLQPAVQAVSPVYCTVPWGGVEQDDFLNAVLLVDDPAADAQEWLRRAQQQEREAQRTRGVRWGPRTLDVDIVDVDGARRDSEHLTLPHPRANQRAFVLVPWYDVTPDAVLPGHGRLADLVAALPSSERDGVRRRDDLELRISGRGVR